MCLKEEKPKRSERTNFHCAKGLVCTIKTASFSAFPFHFWSFVVVVDAVVVVVNFVYSRELTQAGTHEHHAYTHV